MEEKDKWGGFLVDAQEFFISYLAICDIKFLSNRLFLIGHSVELFLKAIYIYQTGDLNGAKGHNVKALFEKCQQNDASFMPNFKFKGSFEELYVLGRKVSDNAVKKQGDFQGLTEDEKEKYVHFIEYQEFYLIADNLANLKYFHTPWYSSPFSKAPSTTAEIFPNFFLIDFVKEAYHYLGYDSDKIEEHLKFYEDGLSANNKYWLSSLYR